MVRTLPLVAGIAILFPCGLVRGLWTDRWAPGAAASAAAVKLERLPMTIGEWQGGPIDNEAAQRDVSKVAGHVMRRYENRVNGNACSLFLACGRPGPLSVHTPEVCYNGAGYELAAPPVKCPVEGASPARPSEFWAAAFAKQESAIPLELRVFWAWNALGAWQAPENPRLAFVRVPVLYKLYVIREAAPGDGRLEDDSCKDFLRRLLPELEKVILANP